jgi:hypothetical protein
MRAMRIQRHLATSVLIGAVIGGPYVSVAHAKDKYQASIVGEPSNATPYTLLKPGSKIKISPSTKPGDGGIVFQLLLKNVDCPTIGNDKNKPGKCGVKDAPPESPVNNHILEIGVRALGNDVPAPGNPLLVAAAGIPFRLEKGKAVFQATGKNKIGGAAFGALSSLIFDQPMGIGLIKLRTPGSNLADCGTAPLLEGNGCNDGDVYAVAGITVGNDPGLTCGSSAECGATAVCTGGKCTPEACTVDADCNEGGGSGGTGQCGSNGTCCDPTIDVSCPGQVP